MTSCDDTLDGYSECTVCRSDTTLLCSPCGDPVCHNCACPNGCVDEELAITLAA